MDSDTFIRETLKFIIQAFSSYAQFKEVVSIIERAWQTSDGTVRIEIKDGRSFLIVMIEDNA